MQRNIQSVEFFQICDRQARPDWRHSALGDQLERRAHRFPFRRDLPAFESAIATACFCGIPAALSRLMFPLIVFRDDPRFNGMKPS
jgi:hypothetical protein